MEENPLFPGRPDYTGPIKGWFGFIHHAVLFEYSHDIMERVDFIKKHKPKNEISTRLNHLISLAAISPFLDSLQSKRDTLDQELRSKQDALYLEYLFKWDALYQEHLFKWDALYQEHRFKQDALRQEYQFTILNYIKQHIPNCTWDGNQLQFPQEE